MDSPLVVRLADTLTDIGNAARTGVLRLSAGGRLRMAFFETGRLVYVVSDVPSEALAPFFARAGRLERAHERLELFDLEKRVTRKTSLVALVLERNLRDEATVRAWLLEHAVEVFARVFDARDLSWKFTPGVKAEHPLPFSIPALELVLEAVRGMRDEETIHEVVGPPSLLTRPVDPPAARPPDLPLSFYEGLVAARVTEPVSIEELVATSGVPETDALRAILALRLSGAIAPFYEGKRMQDSGLLRLLATGEEEPITVDLVDEATAYAFEVTDDDADGPVTMDELENAAAAAAAAPRPASAPLQLPARPRGGSAPLQYPPPRARGDTSRLRLLASAYIQMGEAEAAAGNFAAAVQCFESALAQKPNDLPTMLAYARVHAKRPGGFSAAESLLEKACEAHPKAAAPRIQLARLYLAAGKEDDAEFALVEARRIEPVNAEIRSLFEALGRKQQGPGLLSRLGFRHESRPKPPPPRPVAPFRPQVPTRPPTPADSGDEGPTLRCRYCGRMVQGEARICRSCGATL